MKNVILIVCISILLAACGGRASDPKIPTAITPAAPNTANNSEDNTKVGVFIDAPVKGLAYISAPSGKKGTTNEKGEFEYIDGDTVSFNMGAIELGSATPDKTNMVKVTQLGQALLIAQLLQALDDDVNEDRIDVSDVVIPEAVKQSIIDRLQNKDGDANTADIITEDQLVRIKKVNPKKLTLQQRIKVVSKEKALAHIKQQIGKSNLRFSASELKNLFLIDVSLLKKFEGDNLAFSASNSIRQINVEKNHAEMSDASWELDAKGNLAISFKRDNCTLSKLNEDVDSIDISWSCADKEKPKNIHKGLKYFIKPQPFSANDLSGKSFNFTSLNGNKETLTFRSDGTLNCNDEKPSCSYKDHPSYKNVVWIDGGGDSGEKIALMILAQGSLAKGRFVMIHYKDDVNTLDAVEVMKVSGNTLKQVFEVDSIEGSSANGITYGNIVFTNNVPENAYIRITPAKFQKGGNTSPNYGDSLRCKVQSNGNWGNKDCWISQYGKNNLAEFKPGNKFHFVVFEDTNQDKFYSQNEASICFSGNDAPWNSWSSVECNSQMPLINDSDYDSNDNSNASTQNPTYIPFTTAVIADKTFYIASSPDDEDGLTVFFGPGNKGQVWFSLTDSNTSPDATFDYLIDTEGYIVFSNVKEQGVNSADTPAIGLLGKTHNALVTCWGDDSVSDISDACKEDDKVVLYKTKDAAEDNAQPTADANGFGYAMPEGFTQPPKDAAVTDAIVDYYNPLTEETWQSSTGGYGLAPGWIRGTKEDYETNKEYYDSLIAGVGNIAYIPFTKDMISDKTLYNVYTDWDDQDKDGSTTDWVASTFTFDNSGEGKGVFGIHDSITKADASFNYSINDKGYLILSNVTFTNPEDDPDDGHNSDAIGLITNTGDYFRVCWRGSPKQMDKGCGDDNSFFYKTKEAAETKRTLENQ